MKKLVFRLLYWTGVVRLVAWVNRKRAVFICYHGVTERETRHPEDTFGLHVRKDRFRSHLEYLQKHYRVISLSDYLKASRERQSLPEYAAVITFDDGYRNFYTVAGPLLIERRMPSAMFLIVDRVRQNGDAVGASWADTDDEKYLSWSEIKQLAEKGVEFGSHTCTHRKLTELPSAEVDTELRQSKDAISRQLQLHDLPLAYPYGFTSDSIASVARSLGYSCAITTETGFNDAGTDFFKLRRVLVGDDDDVTAFATRLAGLTR
ncbi:MAG TPA: polysaccharide deacetylase family protein [Pyrinomonadaceae bacterium]|nr:polysaccharide deacetylase family protein [Pyrinomonadaceae bacterium]